MKRKIEHTHTQWSSKHRFLNVVVSLLTYQNNTEQQCYFVTFSSFFFEVLWSIFVIFKIEKEKKIFLLSFAFYRFQFWTNVHYNNTHKVFSFFLLLFIYLYFTNITAVAATTTTKKKKTLNFWFFSILQTIISVINNSQFSKKQKRKQNSFFFFEFKWLRKLAFFFLSGCIITEV